jgi:hypothetical protein
MEGYNHDLEKLQFAADLDLFFQILIDKMEEGRLDPEVVARFFPKDVIRRAEDNQ